MKKNILIYMGALLLSSSFWISGVKSMKEEAFPSVEPSSSASAEFTAQLPRATAYQPMSFGSDALTISIENHCKKFPLSRILECVRLRMGSREEFMRPTQRMVEDIYYPLLAMLGQPEARTPRAASPALTSSGSEEPSEELSAEDAKYIRLIDLAAKNTLATFYTFRKSLMSKLREQTLTSPALLHKQKEEKIRQLGDELAELKTRYTEAQSAAKHPPSESVATVSEGTGSEPPSSALSEEPVTGHPSQTSPPPSATPPAVDLKALRAELGAKFLAIRTLTREPIDEDTWLAERAKIVPDVFAEFITNIKADVTTFTTQAEIADIDTNAIIDAAFTSWASTANLSAPEIEPTGIDEKVNALTKEIGLEITKIPQKIRTVTRLQARVRGLQARKKVGILKQEKAARKIQRIVRGHATRVRTDAFISLLKDARSIEAAAKAKLKKAAETGVTKREVTFLTREARALQERAKALRAVAAAQKAEAFQPKEAPEEPKKAED